MIVIGHRGAALLKPENTLAGWRYAIELGVDCVEGDVRLTRDGHPVILHDATLDRTTNGTGAVSEHTLAEVRRLDAGEGERVPTLDEYLDLVAESGAQALVEMKVYEAIEHAVAGIRRRGLLGRAILTGRLEWMRETKARHPELAVGVPGRSFTLAELDEIARFGAQGVGIHTSALNREIVAACHERGLVVRGWNPTTRPEIERTMACGVDGVTTDRPDIALDLLGRLRRPAGG